MISQFSCPVDLLMPKLLWSFAPWAFAPGFQFPGIDTPLVLAEYLQHPSCRQQLTK
jgi:hypothetical protein